MTDLKKFSQLDADDRQHLSPETIRQLKIESFGLEIGRRLKELKENVNQAKRHNLIPPIVKSDFLSKLSLLEEDEEVDDEGLIDDTAMQISIANRKSKIGVIFGSDIHKSFGAKTVVTEPLVVGKIFGITQGGQTRLRIQAAWANQLQGFYKDLLKGTEYQNTLESTYGPQFTEIVNLLNKILDRVEDYVADAVRKRGQFRSIKGATLLALIPDELKKRFIMDMTDAFLQAEQRNCTGSVLATFVVPEDPFPFLWKAPQGAKIITKQEDAKVSDVFDFERELELEWESEGDRETFFPTGIWEPDIDEEGNPITIREDFLTTNLETGEDEFQTVEHPVVSLSNRPEYQKQLKDFTEKLHNYENYARLNLGEKYIETEAAKKADDKKYRHYIELVKENYGPLTSVVEKSPVLDSGGLLIYLMFSRKPQLKRSLDQFITVFNEFHQAKAAKERDVADQKMKELQSLAKEHFSTREVTPREVSELGFVFIRAKKLPEIERLVEGNYPTNVYDSNVYNNQILPSCNSKSVIMSTQLIDPETETAKTVKVRLPTENNPFYTPKMWPSTVSKADVGWPGRGGTGFSANTFLRSTWRSIPWGTLSLEQKRDNLSRMRQEAEKLREEGEAAEAKKILMDLRVLDQALFMDELRKYIKMNIAFNIDDPDASTPASKVEKAPPLFYYKKQDDIYPVDIADLLDKNRLSTIQEDLGLEPDSVIDIATDSHSNYGLLHEQPEFVQKMMKKQLLARSNLIVKLKRIRRGQVEDEAMNLYFDLDGNLYDSEEELKRALMAKGSVFTLEDKVEIANLLREMAAREIMKDADFEETLDELDEVFEKAVTEQPEPPPVEPAVSLIPEEKLELPAESDDFELPAIQFPEEVARPEVTPVAASLESRTIRKFTNRD